jgi:Xaa-Pro aminopeptidase
MLRSSVLVPFTLLVVSSFPQSGAPRAAAGLTDDLKARRALVLAKLDPATVAVVSSAPVQTYSSDVEYEYRQDSNLLYLTGVEQPKTTLVLAPGAETKEYLFIEEPDARRSVWDGTMLTIERAKQTTGIDRVQYVSSFEPTLRALLSGGRAQGPLADAARGGTAKLGLVLTPRPAPDEELPETYRFANRLRERFLNLSFVDLAPTLGALRQVKTPYEQEVLARSVEISSEAHKAGMREVAPGKFEYQVEAAIEQVYLANGAMSWGYPSIVGSGPNALILHYNASSRKMEDGDVLLVDAAANYQGLTGDVTRTYPVNGRFTDAQKDLYRIVFEAQEAGIRTAKVGSKTADIEKAVAEVQKAGLLKVGLITDASGAQYRMWTLHQVCHWIGMDVHDVGDYDRPLAPGMTFVIEPGIYINEAFLQQLPQTPDNRTLIEKVGPAVKKYRNIGVRLEDSFLLTANGLRNLSASVPRTIEEIEGFIHASRKSEVESRK